MKFIAVKQNGLAIKLIKNPSEELKLAAVKQNGDAIKWIDNPSEELQLAAVKQDGSAIRHIDNPSKELQLASLWDSRARKYVTYGLELPTIHYEWKHNNITNSEIFFKKNLSKIRKYFDINFF